MINGVDNNEREGESLELLYEVGREVANALDLQTVLERVLLLSMKNVNAVSGSIIVTDDIGQPFDSAFSIMGQAHDSSALQLRITYERGMAGWVARNREAALISDTSKDDRWLRRPDDESDRTGPKSAIIAPIQTNEGLVGVITLVHPEPGFFSLDHLSLLQAIADHAGSAIRNARLFKNLQMTQKRYQDLFEDCIDPIIITDINGQILEVNHQAEKFFASERDHILKINLCERLHSENGKSRNLFENLSTEEVICFESELGVGELKTVPVQICIRQIRNSSTTQLQWLMRDISERKLLDTMREDLIAMVYHDLRSPLANITSSLEVLSGFFEESRDESIHSLISIASRSTERIQRLTASLLDLYRLETGQQIGEHQLAAPEALIAESIDVVNLNAGNRDLILTWDVEDNLPYVDVDPDMIRRVLINLLENAIKFTPTKGKIHVSARFVKSHVEFSVSDTGQGIPYSDQARIFEKFIRLSPRDGRKGLGLGLAFCKLAIEAHNGEIWVESEPGRGSTFKFFVPAANVTNKEKI